MTVPFLEQMGAVAGLGLSGGTGIYIAKFVMEKVFARWEKKEALIDVGTEKLVRSLEGQVRSLEERLDRAYKIIEDLQTDLSDCKKQHADSFEEMAKLRAQLGSRGMIAQEASKVLAADRLGLTVRIEGDNYGIVE